MASGEPANMATIEGALKMPAPITTPTMMATASRRPSTCLGLSENDVSAAWLGGRAGWVMALAVSAVISLSRCMRTPVNLPKPRLRCLGNCETAITASRPARYGPSIRWVVGHRQLTRLTLTRGRCTKANQQTMKIRLKRLDTPARRSTIRSLARALTLASCSRGDQRRVPLQPAAA